jgi:sigma-E factor negative regulatory protein RseB
MIRLFFYLFALVLPTALFAQDRAPAEWLTAMAKAVDETPYSGRLLYLSGTRLSTMEVSHAVLAGQSHERVVHLDDSGTELIRVGDETICIHADGSLTRLAADQRTDLLAAKTRMAKALPEQYQVRSAGDERVAGRMAHKVELTPNDNFRYAYNVWIDQTSALPLKVETVNNHGQALERLEFVSLDVEPGLSEQNFALPDGYQQLKLPSTTVEDKPSLAVSLAVNWLPPGFRKVEADIRFEEGIPVLAETFSDGVATFTVFVNPQAAGQLSAATISFLGPTLVVESAVDTGRQTYVVTFIGEVPATTAEQVLSHLKLVLD